MVGRRMSKRRQALVAFCLVAGILALGAPPALAGIPITFQPPAGAHVSTQGDYFRTTDPQPTIGIQADGGTALRCGLDVFPPLSQPCGPRLPGCTAVLCASYRPPAPLADRPAADHTLAVEVVDATGQDLQDGSEGFTVDGTPPAVKLDFVDRQSPLHPVFNFRVFDDQPVAGDITVTDPFACALVPLRAKPSFGRCPVTPSDTGIGATYHLPRRHRDYRFWVRAADDFGRTTIMHHDYDPVPCALTASLPHRLAAVAAGIAVRVACSYVGTVDIGLWPIAVNGRTFAHSPAQTVATRPLLAGLRLRGRGSHWTARRRLTMTRSFAGQTLRFTSVRFLMTACPPTDLNPCGDRNLDASWSYLTFTARR